jgi:hypothetical protein
MTDRFTVRAVVVGLILIALCAIVGIIWTSLAGWETPEALVAIGSGAAGALGGVLARTSSEG